MFSSTGAIAMTSLDLGPSFTKIVSPYTDMFKYTGKGGVCIITAPTAITQNKHQFKLSSSSTTKIDYFRGTINPPTKYSLKSTSSEKDAFSGFLGNSTVERKNIQKVEFKRTLSGVDTSTVWDASASGDYSVVGWLTSSAPYTAYIAIGEDKDIYAAANSSYLFAYIGFASNCTATLTISNLTYLNTSEVTNMEGMFWFTGYTSMTSLPLGSNFSTANVTNMRGMFAGTGYLALPTLNLGSAFNTAKVTDMSWMFANTGYTAMTGITFGSSFNTAAVTDMSYMFMECGYTAMTSLTLPTGFNTAAVTDMSHMFEKAGYTAMTSLNLGSTFNTANVTDMNSMFRYCGVTAMTSFSLGSNFDTSKVTDMTYMFADLGRNELTSLSLGSKFNTSSVTKMQGMFYNCTHTLTTLSLGDKFYTTNVTTMESMFRGLGNTSMTSLELGPAFTKIASTNSNMFTDTGKNGGCTIYVAESIYKTRTTAKLSATDTTASIAYSRGTFNPKFRPVWTHTSTLDTTNKRLTVTLTGQANSGYTSNVTTTLAASDISVYIDGVDVTSTTNPTKTLNAANPTTGSSISHTFVISNLGEAARAAGKSYKEWSGNISIKIKGRGEATSTYSEKVLYDAYGNQSMMALDSTGTWVDIKLSDAAQIKNTSGKMFIDYVTPEFTYLYSNTTIDKTNKKVTVVFDVIDKYFKSTNITKDNITINLGGTGANSNTTKTLTKVQDLTDTTTANTSGKIGERYRLEVTDIDKGAGTDYSGTMTLAFAANAIEDQSGNKSSATSITIGVDEKDGNANSSAPSGGVTVDVVSPIWRVQNVQTTLNVVSGAFSSSMDVIGIDKYYSTNTLTKDNIVVQKGSSNLTVTRTLTAQTAGTGESVKYKFTISGTAALGDVVKVTIPASTLTDQSSNTNTALTTNIDLSSSGVGSLTVKLGSLTGSDYNAITGAWTNQNAYIYATAGSGTTTYSVNGGTAKGTGTGNATTISSSSSNTVTLTTTLSNGTISLTGYTVKVDKTAPTLPTYVAYYKNATSETYTSGTWYNLSKGIVLTRISSTDAHSGISAIKYSQDQTNWTTFSFSEGALTQSGTTWSGVEPWSEKGTDKDRDNTFYFKAIDVAGNESAISSAFNIKYDSHAPTNLTYTTSYSDGTGTYTSGTWYNSSKGSVRTTITGTDTKYNSVASGIEGIYYKEVGATGWTKFGFAVTALAETDGSTAKTAVGTENCGSTDRNQNYDFKVVDKAGNETEISGSPDWNIRYDKTKPTITVSPTSATVCKSKSITITAADPATNSVTSGLASGTSYSWFLSTSATPTAAATGTGLAGTYTSGSAFTIGSGLTGTYYLFVRQLTDNASNLSTVNGTVVAVNSVNYHRFGTYIFDNGAPTITVNPTSATACKSKSVTITTTDVGSAGLSVSTGTYSWFLSTSATPSAAATGTGVAGTYTSGSAFTIGSNLTGTYYLFVKQVSDTLGTVSTTNGTVVTVGSDKYHRFGTYIFDNTNPTISVNPTSATVCKTKSITITAADTVSGLATSGNSYQYFLSTSSTALTGGSWTDYTNGTAFTAGTGLTGTYYLFVKTVTDVVGNASATNGTIQAVDSVNYHRFGTYVFDNTLPVISPDVVQDNLLRNYDADNNNATGHIATGTTWKDLSGTNNATVTGATWSTENQPDDEYLSLDGSNDWVNLGVINAVNSNITLEATVKINSYPSSGSGYIITNYQTGGVALYINTSGTLYMGAYNSTSSSYVTANSGVKLNTGTKYHLVGTFDGTSLKVYVDGVLKKEEAFSGAYKEPNSNTVMALGTNPEGSSATSPYLKMNVYSVRAYGKALSQAEVTQNYNASITNKTWAKSHNITGMISDSFSGLATGASLQYAWSTSATTAPSFSTAATITSYTAGAANTSFAGSGSGYTGKYFLWVKPVTLEDLAGNSNTTNKVSSTRVYFDNTAPTAGALTMKLGTSSGNAYTGTWSGTQGAANAAFTGSWTNQSIYIALANGTDTHSGHGVTTWSATKDGAAYTLSGTTATLSTDGTYVITVTTTDNAGNSTSNTYTIKIDKTAPTIAVDTTTADWRSTALSVKATVTETGGSGLVSGTEYKWFLSTSSTPSSVPTGASVSGTYTSGSSFDINPGTNGTYYLFIQSVKDNAGSTSTSNGTNVTVSSVVYHRYGTYKFEYTAPTVTVNNTSATWRKSAQSIKITVADTGGSGLASATDWPRQWYLSNSGTALTTGSWTGDSWTTYTSGTAFNINPGVDGEYYLFVKKVSDNAGILSTAAGSTDTTIDSVSYHRFGPYQFDYTAPVWNTQNFNVNAATQTVTVDIVGTDALSGYSSNSLDKDDITIYIDETAVTGLTKVLSTATTVTGGIKYTLTLTGWEETNKIQTNKLFKEWSGTTKIRIAASTLTDVAGNSVASATDKVIGFVDVIKPSIVYRTSNTTIDTSGKTVTVIFDITDKYYSASTLTTNDLTISIDGENISTDANVTKTFSMVDLVQTTAINKTISGTVQTGLTNQVVGKRVTVTIEGLEQDEIESGDKYLDYSGSLTIAVAGNKITDTSSLANENKSLTVGIDLPENTGTATTIDFVAPKWELVSSVVDLDTGTAVITVRGTDKYFKTNSLTNTKIVLLVEGTATTTGITKTINSTTLLKEQRTTNGTTTEVQYGVDIEFTITGIPVNENQVKVRIPAATLTDNAGNTNELFEFGLYNTIVSAASETAATSGFLGSAQAYTNGEIADNIQRQDIESVTFVTSVSGATANKWDVSELQDDSVLAWYTKNANGSYKVYIGSDEGIVANIDSSYLFSYIGSSSKCTATTVISGLENFRTYNTTSMKHMFAYTGANAMTSLTLPASFNTRNVSNMEGMFLHCGENAMISLELPILFDTSSVTDMTSMFEYCGNVKMTSLTLSSAFNTSAVTEMDRMFAYCGSKLLSTLTLPSAFNTIAVTTMKEMFMGCGKESMTTLTLSTAFDTSSVNNMSSMFEECGYTKMESLDLGNLFKTTSVNDMSKMFKNCGYTKMTYLDLGPQFTHIPTTNTDFMTNCGTTSLVVYAPESIYSAIRAFKTN